MAIYQKIFRPVLFQFSAEVAHHLGMGSLQFLGGIPWLSELMVRSFQPRPGAWAQTLWGLNFPNPVGLAAGLDKNGEAVSTWPALGFGFCEIGTVTPLPQPGNPKPRLFRLPEDQAIINRMGFNNCGSQDMALRLEQTLKRIGKSKIPLGINIGKGKATPLEKSLNDYRLCLERLYPYGDYFVVNISSPNTPGLRDLQSEDFLKPLLNGLKETIARLSKEHASVEKPLLVKLAPDLENEQLISLVDIMERAGVQGVILGNTYLKRPDLKSVHANEAGGLSGKPLAARSTEMVQIISSRVRQEFVVIGCGGIFSGQDALEKLNAGAKLVQVYTGLIYNGPTFPRSINEFLDQNSDRNQKDG